MLPFLKPKTIAGLIISKRKPDGSVEEQHTQGEEDTGLDSCSEALIRAVHSKDARAVSSALKHAFELLELQAREEQGEAESSPHTYDAQNEAAVKYTKEQR